MATKDMTLTPNEEVMEASKAVRVELRKSIDEAAGSRSVGGRKSRSAALKGARAFRKPVGGARSVQVKDLELTEELAEAFYAVASRLAEGRTVVVGTAEDELTTTRAAAELGMSRPKLISLLQAGELDYHMVGSHRRISRREVLRYKEARVAKAPAHDEERKAALRRMAEISNKAGEGY